MLLYLIGAMNCYDKDGCFEKASGWREKICSNINIKDTGINVFNACIDYKYNREYNARGNVYQNLAYLKKTDIAIINLYDLDKSPGSLFELYYCFFNHIPVFSFGENILYPDQPHVAESITMHFGCKENVIDDIVLYIKNMYGQKY